MAIAGAENAPRLAVAALGFRVPQDRLISLMTSCRMAFECALEGSSTQASPLVSTALIVDDPDQELDLDRLSGCVDILSFSVRRRGFGVSRSTALHTVLLTQASLCMLMDADGHHEAVSLADLLTRVTQSPTLPAAVIPQRSLVDLPLHGDGSLDRHLAERFEAYCVANAAGRPDLADADFQPGLFLLTPVAARYLRDRVQSRRYSWDLEASYLLLTSGLTLGFPRVETFAQDRTSFSLSDSQGNLRFLTDLCGATSVITYLEQFRHTSSLLEAFGREAIDAHCLYVRQSIGSPIPGLPLAHPECLPSAGSH